MKALFLLITAGIFSLVMTGWVMLSHAPTPTQPQSVGAEVAAAIAASATCQVNADGRWLSAGVISLSRCAGLAGKIANQNSKVIPARWNAVDVRVSGDGTFVQVVKGKAASTHYWDSDKLVEDIAQDIDRFWQREFAARGWRYQSPTRIQSYAQRIRTGCGLASLNNAFYCQLTHGIYYDTNLLAREFDRVGDFASAIIIAHEWGHAVQGLRDIFRQSRYTIETELQADCFAGAYARDANLRGLLEPGDSGEAAELLYKIGDPAHVPWYARGAHGSPQQRVGAFEKGFKAGLVACF
ncbi:MAG: neutral zinc metallopeptidase [Anaerolineae bacterium]|nr:neutral zinc metallopeptidase [Anaerolineae bacterium]